MNMYITHICLYIYIIYINICQHSSDNFVLHSYTYIHTCIHDCAPFDFFGLKRLHVLC